MRGRKRRKRARFSAKCSGFGPPWKVIASAEQNAAEALRTVEPKQIAERLGIGRTSVYRLLGKQAKDDAVLAEAAD